MGDGPRVVVAPQEFKGSLSAAEAAQALAAGVARGWPEARIDQAPLSDGGPGFVEAMLSAAGGTWVEVSARDPLGRPVPASFGVLADGTTAVIEMAAAAGLWRLSRNELDPLRTTTAGVGDLIRAALDVGARRLLIGLGGSATNDAGAGMAQALGARLLDADGRDLPAGGAALAHLERLDVTVLGARLEGVTIVGATDVRNPLCGLDGASAIYGPQKGADAAAVAVLDGALRRFAEVAARDLGRDVLAMPGSGAAGGLGAGLIAFFGAELLPGFPLVAETVGLQARIEGAALVLTGEGRLDGQSGWGKTVAGVARLGAAAGVPVVALCGALEGDWRRLHAEGLTAAFSVMPGPISLDDAQKRAAALVQDAGEQAVRLFLGARSESGQRAAQGSQGVGG